MPAQYQPALDRNYELLSSQNRRHRPEICGGKDAGCRGAATRPTGVPCRDWLSPHPIRCCPPERSSSTKAAATPKYGARDGKDSVFPDERCPVGRSQLPGCLHSDRIRRTCLHAGEPECEYRPVMTALEYRIDFRLRLHRSREIPWSAFLNYGRAYAAIESGSRVRVRSGSGGAWS